MELNLKLKVSREILENIFVTAIEGGSNYWCSISEESHGLIRTVVPKSVEPIWSVAVFKAVYDFGICVRVVDAEDEETEIGLLSVLEMHDRLQLLLDNNEYKDNLLCEMNDEGDATSSDICFQYLVLGEVIYS